MKIKQAIRWSNDMVMVFDERGEQVAELQGTYTEKREAVLAAADDETEFRHGVWRDGMIPWPRETW